MREDPTGRIVSGVSVISRIAAAAAGVFLYLVIFEVVFRLFRIPVPPWTPLVSLGVVVAIVWLLGFKVPKLLDERGHRP